MNIPSKMKAVTFNGPYSVSVIETITPRVSGSDEVLLKVKYSGICGTDLHSYRGHITLPKGQIIGHEFVGIVVETGDGIKESDFKIGDEVLSTFTIQCGKCYFCKHGYSGQCINTNTFGKVGLNGGQAEYVLIPFANTTLIKVPKESKTDALYVLMADIFVTAYYGVKKIINFLQTEPMSKPVGTFSHEITVLQLGAGPVGLCALRILKHLGFKNIVCLDNVPSRLEAAIKMGALHAFNFENKDQLKEITSLVTNGNGYDAILEVVGSSEALETAYEFVRGNGYISSLGMPHDSLPFSGLQCYMKNVNITFGRCHAWSLFPEALEIFEQVKDDFSDFIDHKIPISEASNAFSLFNEHKINKAVLDFSI